MSNNIKWAKKPYKYGGHNVPGMFKAQDGGPFGTRRPGDGPIGGPKKRNWFGRQGTRIANIFRSDLNDRSVMYKNQYKNPWKRNRGNFNPNIGNFGNTGNQPGGMLIRRRGGSAGPNGIL